MKIAYKFKYAYWMNSNYIKYYCNLNKDSYKEKTFIKKNIYPNAWNNPFY